MCKKLIETTKAFGVKHVLKYVNSSPEENIPKILNWLEKHNKGRTMAHQVQMIRESFENKDGNCHKLAMSLWTDLDDSVRLKLFENFVVNVNMIGGAKEQKFSAENDCNVPWAILMDPTSACNLHCTGCWASEYGNKLNLTLDELNDIIRQGKAMGTYFYIFSGGEPTVRRDDIFRLCEMNPECAFLAFTNATLIDEAFADEMLRVKNFVPAISVEGFEEATDSRRGKGTYAKVIRAMEILKRKKLLFGISLCYTSRNTEVIGSDEFIDTMIEYGAKFAWFFTYIPVGIDAATELIATAQQRRFMYDKIRAWRKTKAIFSMDFWNDGEFVGGCIAGGRKYLHINANGDIEPCAFIHYSDSNIREQTLLEAYKRPLFMAYRRNQPFNKNMLRPCPLLDNAGKLAEMVDSSGGHSTDLKDPEDVHELCGKCFQAAACWKPVADALWAESEHVKSEAAKRGEAV